MTFSNSGKNSCLQKRASSLDILKSRSKKLDSYVKLRMGAFWKTAIVCSANY